MSMPTSTAPQPPLAEIARYVRENGVAASARAFDLSDSTIRRRAKKAGLRFQIGRPRSREKAHRNAEIFRLRQEGQRLAQIGLKYGIRAERVRQILEDLGGDPLKKPTEPAQSVAAHP